MGRKLNDNEKLERDIQKAQDKVSRIFHKLEPIREEYRVACDELSELIDQKNGTRDSKRKEIFIEALQKSDRSFEDVLAFLDGTFDEW